MLCGLLWLMSRLIPLLLLLQLLLLILLLPLLMRGLLSLVPWLILLLLRLILLLPQLIRRVTFTVALAASAAITTDFETSGQGMAAVGPVQAPVDLFYADEATLQVIQTGICLQRKFPFLGGIGGREVHSKPNG